MQNQKIKKPLTQEMFMNDQPLDTAVVTEDTVSGQVTVPNIAVPSEAVQVAAASQTTDWAQQLQKQAGKGANRFQQQLGPLDQARAERSQHRS